MYGGYNPLMYGMMGGMADAQGSEIPLQAGKQSGNFIDMYLKGMAMRSMQNERTAQAADAAAKTADTQVAAATNQRKLNLTQGMDAYFQGGDSWAKYQKQYPQYANEAQDMASSMKAGTFLKRTQAGTALLKTIPLTQAGYQAYNSDDMTQKFASLDLVHPQYKDYREFFDGMGDLQGKMRTVAGNATDYAGLVRQYSDPNSPLYHDKQIGGRIQDLETLSKANIARVSAETARAQAQTTKAQAATANSAYGGKSRPTLGALRDSASGMLRNMPGYSEWANAQDDPKAGDKLAGQVAGAVLNGYSPKGAYVGQAPQDALQAELGRVSFPSSGALFKDYNLNYVPSGGAASAPAAAAPAASSTPVTRQDTKGNTWTVQNGQWVMTQKAPNARPGGLGGPQ